VQIQLDVRLSNATVANGLDVDAPSTNVAITFGGL
jgi:hypothetical protein